MPFRNLLSRLSENEYTTKDSICKIDMFYDTYRHMHILRGRSFCHGQRPLARSKGRARQNNTGVKSTAGLKLSESFVIYRSLSCT